MKNELTIPLIEKASQVLSQILPETPLLQNPGLSEKFQAEIYLKYESLQPVGSFKVRGAAFKISQLTPGERQRGIITASAGNHAQGVAWSGRHYSVQTTVVMPKNVSIVKLKNTERLGAKVILEGKNYDEAGQVAQNISKETGATYIHAFDDPLVMAGQGTCGVELLRQLPNPDFVIGSIGGGGLMSGVGTWIHEFSPKTKLIGTQAAGCSPMFKAFDSGRIEPLSVVKTFADGIAVGKPRETQLKILESVLDRILIADDEQIARAVVLLLERARVLAEGAAAISVAVLSQIKEEIRGKKVVVLLCGGNLDVNILHRIIDRGLTVEGRRVRLNVVISDQPGSLAKITQIISDQGGNIIQTIHDRNESYVQFDQTEVAITMETKGKEHTKEIINALQGQVIEVHLR